MNLKNKKTLAYAAVIILVIIACIAGAFIIKGNNPSGENKDTSVAPDLSYLDDILAFEIETKYCSLYFPEEYEESIKVEFTEDAGYKAEFYALVEDREPAHIFDICFNSDDGNLLGYIEDKENEEIVNLSVDVIELEFDDDWSQEEMDQVYSMQEENNFVVDSLSKIENYVNPDME